MHLLMSQIMCQLDLLNILKPCNEGKSLLRSMKPNTFVAFSSIGSSSVYFRWFACIFSVSPRVRLPWQICLSFVLILKKLTPNQNEISDIKTDKTEFIPVSGEIGYSFPNMARNRPDLQMTAATRKGHSGIIMWSTISFILKYCTINMVSPF
jgi:hypothetical protein